MHDHIFANRQGLSASTFSSFAETLDLDVKAFDACMADGRHDAAIRQDVEAGKKAGVSGTPTFLLGRRKAGTDEVEILEKIVGAHPFATFEQKIRSHLDSE
jgi:predicted DsbA family dithiol-disulfide isomerase